MLAAGDSASISPAVIAAASALAGVCLSQAITWLERRREDKRRRRTEMAQTLAPTFSLIMQATEQIDRGARSETDWRTQSDWTRLRTQTWPSVRTLLLTQVTQNPDLSDTLYELTLRLQNLLESEERDDVAARHAWEAARSQVAALLRR